MTKVSSINERIRDFVLQRFPLARRRTIGHDEPLLEQGVLDSLGVLDLVGFLEQEFSITVSDEELVPQNFGTIKSMAALIQKKWNEKASEGL